MLRSRVAQLLLFAYGLLSKQCPFLGPLNTRCRIILRTPKGTIILTTTHMFDLRVSDALLPAGDGFQGQAC